MARVSQIQEALSVRAEPEGGDPYAPWVAIIGVNRYRAAKLAEALAGRGVYADAYEREKPTANFLRTLGSWLADRPASPDAIITDLPKWSAQTLFESIRAAGAARHADTLMVVLGEQWPGCASSQGLIFLDSSEAGASELASRLADVVQHYNAETRSAS